VFGLIGANLGRSRARTLLTATGIAVGIGTIVALLSLTTGFKRSASGLIHLGRADLGLFQKSVSDPTQSALPESMIPRIRRSPGVATATPLELVVEAVKSDPAAIVFGADRGGFVSQRLVFTSGRHAAAPREAVVGDVFARLFHLEPGSTVKLKKRKFKVAGVFHSGITFEDNGVIVSLRDAQRLNEHEGSVTTIAVNAQPNIRLKALAKRLTKVFPGTLVITDAEELARADPNLRLINKAVAVIVVLALILGGIAVTNTILMAVLERRRELALMAAVGWSPFQIGLIIIGEGVGLSLIGAAIGLVLGIAASELTAQALSVSSFVGFSPSITAWGLGRGLIVGFAIGVFGGLYPAWRVTRSRPAAALARP
jgi:putative ABC transport system permease protein